MFPGLFRCFIVLFTNMRYLLANSEKNVYTVMVCMQTITGKNMK